MTTSKLGLNAPKFFAHFWGEGDQNSSKGNDPVFEMIYWHFAAITLQLLPPVKNPTNLTLHKEN